MAEVVADVRNSAGFRWSAVFAGTFVTLGAWILLYAFGLAVGLSALDPNDLSSAKAAGIGTGIWSLVAPLIALFAGGMVTGRVAGVVDRGGAAMHGAVLWGLTTVGGILAVGMALASLLGGIAAVGGKAVSGAASAASNSDVSGAAQSVGIDANTLLGPVNQKLREQGKPEITADQLQGTMQEVVPRAMREGHLDRQLLVTSIARNTSLSRADAEDLANQVQQQFDQTSGQVQQKLQQVGKGAAAGAHKSSAAFWGIFAVLLLGLISAVLGASMGVTKRQRAAASAAVPAQPLMART
jgi:hypothetical protein